MDLTSYTLHGPVAAAGMCYLIVAQQIQMGFPPFYRRGVAFLSFSPFGHLKAEEVERQIKLVLPFIGGMMVAMVLFLATRSPLCLGLMGLIGVAGGLYIRRDLRRMVGVPMQWVSSYWTLKWPMLVFDVWAISFAAFMASLPAL